MATGEPLDKAGAYAVQGVGGTLVERVEGSRTNVIGLPLDETLALLHEIGARRAVSEATEIAAQLRALHARIAAAAARAGRAPGEIALVGVARSRCRPRGWRRRWPPASRTWARTT